MNFSYSNTAEVVGQELKIDPETADLIARISSFMEQYPAGSGRYAQVQLLQENAETWLRSLKQDSDSFKALFPYVRDLGALLKSEQERASELAVERGISTEAREAEKRAQYEQQRAEKDLSFIEDFPDYTPPEKGGPKMGTILTIAAAGVGAYLLLR